MARLVLGVCVLTCPLLTHPSPADANPGRRAGWFTRAMVVCDSRASADAGVRILEQGNAVDAAVATAFALTVTFPWAAPI